MVDFDPVMDILTFGITLGLILIFVVVLAPKITDNNVDARIDSNNQYMKSQELALSYIRNQDGEPPQGDTHFRQFVKYYSMDGGDTYPVNGEEPSKDDLRLYLKTQIENAENYRSGNFVSWIEAEGITDNEHKSGVTMPIPAAGGEVRKVWVWK